MLATNPANPLPAYRRPPAEVVDALGSDAKRGLPAAEIPRRLQRYGRNELPAEPPVPAWRRFLAQFKDTLTLLLLVATLVSFIAWWIERDAAIPYEALTIIAIVILNGVLGFVQESRAEHAIAALEAMSAPNARVLRDGEPRSVPTAEIVPGDVLLLEEGDTVAADGRVLESIAMRAAESALTGESAPVSKDSGTLADEAGIADRSNMVFSGTAISSGRGRAIVTASGPRTEIGNIARSLQVTQQTRTPLQKELDRTGKLLGIAVIAIAVVMGATILFVEHLKRLTELVDVLLLAVSLAVAAVPEGLTAITTIVLSLGTQRMAKRNVIVRRLSSVETLGSTTTICSDKTGTLTKNEMTVRAVVTASGRVDLTGAGYEPVGEVQQGGAPVKDKKLLEEVEKALVAGDLANNAALLEKNGRWSIQGDPTEGALVVAARKVGPAAKKSRRRYPRVGEVPFSSERKLMSTAHADTEQARTMVFVKGAPDVLLARCTEEQVGEATRALTPARRSDISRTIDELGSAALRTIGVAYRTLGADAHKGQLGEEVEQALVFLGVVGMIDPPRPEARQSVAEAKAAGIRPILITGDHPVTAAAIAAELGISAKGAKAISGAQLEKTSDEQLQRDVREVSVYARVAPEHKLRIVRALNANGEIVAMTGDGVNDAPALKAADIGVAMGIAGTDVAKGAADMILMDDNFASIVAAVEEGRSIFANIQRFLQYLLSSNIGEVLVMFLGVIFAGTIGLVPEEGSLLVAPLLATQILWINLLTDSGPALALGVEPPDHDVMLRPPRDPRRRVIDGSAWIDIVFVGLIMAVGTLLVMDWALPGGLIPAPGTGRRGLRYAQTMAFTTLVLFQLFNSFNARFRDRSAFRHLFRNRWIWLAALASVALQAAVIHLPFLQRAFSTVPLDGRDWMICAAVSSSVLWLTELKKLFVRPR